MGIGEKDRFFKNRLLSSFFRPKLKYFPIARQSYLMIDD